MIYYECESFVLQNTVAVVKNILCEPNKSVHNFHRSNTRGMKE